MILNKGLHRKIFTAVIQSNIRLQHPVKIIFAYVCILYWISKTKFFRLFPEFIVSRYEVFLIMGIFLFIIFQYEHKVC